MGFKQGDVEQDYERRPRASKEDGPAAGRELLPVREGGKWQRRTAPAPKGEPQTKKGKQRAKARAQATTFHVMTELERASSGYKEAASERTKAEAAEDAAEARLEAVLRALERGQPGSSGVKAE